MTPQQALERIVEVRRQYPSGVPAPATAEQVPGPQDTGRFMRAAVVNLYAGRLAELALHPSRHDEADLWAQIGAVAMAALERININP